MRVSPKTYAIGLYESLKDGPEKTHKEIINNFLRRLLNRNEFKKINRILEEFASHLDRINRVERISVVSARPINDKLKRYIKDEFKKRLEAKEIVIQESVRPEALGGLQIIYGDQTINATLKNRLAQLKTKLYG